jgi:DHA1 family bicyclomycin/chloramphenicol resistance-like MFS transporter
MIGIDLDLNAWLMFIIMVLFFMGLTFGNLQSVAMEPMGAIAGTASTMIGSLMTGISLTVGITFSQFMAGSTGPLIVTFFLTGLTALLLISTNDASQPTS